MFENYYHPSLGRKEPFPSPITCHLSRAECLAEAANLRGVIVRVGGVNPEPVRGGVAARLGVRALARPVRFGHRVKELGGGGACAAQGVERGGDVALVVAQARSVRFLVVALYLRAFFGQELAQADGAVHLAVGEVLDDLARAPLAPDRVCGQLLFGEAFEAARDFVGAGFVLRDECLSLFLCHITPACGQARPSGGGPEKWLAARRSNARLLNSTRGVSLEEPGGRRRRSIQC